MKHALVMLACVLVAGAAYAVEIEVPEVGSTTVTVSDLTIPVTIGGKAMAPRVPQKTQTNTVPLSGGFVMLLEHYRTASGYTTDYRMHLPRESPVTVELANPFMEDTTLIAVDLLDGRHDRAGSGRKGAAQAPEPSFDLEGFEPASAWATITGLEPSARVFSAYMSPGHSPTFTEYMDGAWSDRDGLADGVITADIPRFSGPPYAVAGDLWVLALEGADRSSGVWTAEGDRVRYTVAVASHIIGATGTPFISDLVISNPVGLSTSGWVRFVGEGTSWADAQEMTFSVGPGETVSWSDVLQSGLGITDNVKGALYVGGFPMWSLQVSSRNYAVDGDGRRFGIAIPGLPSYEPLTSQETWIIPGLRENEQYRSNLIVASAAPQACTIRIRLFVAGQIVASETRVVPEYGLLQINRVASTLGAGTVDDGYVEITVASAGIHAALSVVDGTADDASYILARSVLQ